MSTASNATTPTPTATAQQGSTIVPPPTVTAPRFDLTTPRGLEDAVVGRQVAAAKAGCHAALSELRVTQVLATQHAAITASHNIAVEVGKECKPILKEALSEQFSRFNFETSLDAQSVQSLKGIFTLMTQEFKQEALAANSAVVENMSKSMNELVARNGQQSIDLAQKGDRITSLVEKNGELQAQVQALKGEVDVLKERNSGLQTEVSHQDAMIDSQNQQIENLKDEIARLKGEVGVFADDEMANVDGEALKKEMEEA
ncbi:hypothetical protein JCM5350_003089 [Sporobolomyces pararoseus]